MPCWSTNISSPSALFARPVGALDRQGMQVHRDPVVAASRLVKLEAAIDEGVPVHVLTAALYERFSSRGEADFADKLLSSMRYEFGGHLEKK